MARKKKDLKLFNTHYSPFRQALLHDRPLIINFFKEYPNTIITSTDLMNYLDLEASSQSSVSVGIKLINKETDLEITTIPSKGYVYYTEEN
jgi:hypothetical protein